MNVYDYSKMTKIECYEDFNELYGLFYETNEDVNIIFKDVKLHLFESYSFPNETTTASSLQNGVPYKVYELDDDSHPIRISLNTSGTPRLWLHDYSILESECYYYEGDIEDICLPSEDQLFLDSL